MGFEDQINTDEQEAVPQGALLTVEETAMRIHPSISANFVRSSIRKGEIAAIRLGRRYYITECEVERFLTCRANANQPASTSAKMMAHGSSLTAANTSGLDLVTDFMTKQQKH